MAIADYASLRAAIDGPSQRFDVVKPVTTVGTGKYNSFWRFGGNPAQGAIPAASAVPDRTTVGGLGQLNPSAGALYAFIRKYHGGAAVNSHGKLVLIDRLVHMGGLDGTNVGAQTVSTSALTRYTSGDGVYAAVEVYSALGATPQTVTISYTNQAAASGRTSQPIDLIANVAGGSFLPISLQAGDFGVQAVSTATLSASTGSVGNFGITLYKPLLSIPLFNISTFPFDADPVRTVAGYLPQISTDACLMWLMFLGSAQVLNPTIDMGFIEA